MAANLHLRGSPGVAKTPGRGWGGVKFWGCVLTCGARFQVEKYIILGGQSFFAGGFFPLHRGEHVSMGQASLYVARLSPVLLGAGASGLRAAAISGARSPSLPARWRC